MLHVELHAQLMANKGCCFQKQKLELHCLSLITSSLIKPVSLGVHVIDFPAKKTFGVEVVHLLLLLLLLILSVILIN